MKKILVILISILILTGCSFENEKSKVNENNIILYGKLSQFSTSGAMKFNYYDIENNKIIDSKEKPWFWASPDINDKIKLDSFVKYVDDNKDSVFKITGKKESDDCGYIEGICFEDIAVDIIEVLKK